MIVAAVVLLEVPARAQSPMSSSARANQHQKLDISRLRHEATAKHQILRITFYPDIDSVPNIDKIYDMSELAEVKFIDVPKVHK